MDYRRNAGKNASADISHWSLGNTLTALQAAVPLEGIPYAICDNLARFSCREYIQRPAVGHEYELGRKTLSVGEKT